MQKQWTCSRAAIAGSILVAAGCGVTETRPAAERPEPPSEAQQRMVQNRADLDFILEQIRIAEAHAGGAALAPLVGSPLLPFGLRTVDGSFNNLVPGQELFGAADQLFPRYAPPVFRDAEGAAFDPDGPGPLTVGSPTSYSQTRGLVFDSEPRVVSNLIVDQTSTNPAAVAVAGVTGAPGETLFIENVAPDVGLSAPFNSWFTFFGQFFDHGLDLTNKGGSGTVFVPLKADDPLFDPGPDGDPATTADNGPNFMVLTRATNQPGPDGVRGTADDVREHVNQTTPFVDQNQTYASHPSHQVFLREYVLDGAGKPVATGRMLDGARGGIGNWAEVKAQARDLLGIDLTDADVPNLPLLATDAYGRFQRGPGGFAQLVRPGPVLVEGSPASPVSTAGAVRTGHAFLDDIAHTAAPAPGLTPDPDSVIGGGPQPAGTYDDELLAAHFVTGDGRGNENIGLTAVHTIFHAEHNRLVQHVKDVVQSSGDPAYVANWLLPGADQTDGVQPLEWDGERLFQAARFGTEMQYQHLVFEEFARKVQPEVNVFAGYDTSINPAIMAEFAHTVYRFGHSMLTETVSRTAADGTPSDIGLIEAFLNPVEFSASGATDLDAAGAVIRGLTRQTGNEIDEFVTGALRSNLLGLPLDLATINLARGRDTGVPSLNRARALFFAETSNSALRPYESWTDFGLGIKHPESLINFVAAYGTHPDVAGATTAADKRAAAAAIVLGGAGAPADAVDFLNGTGAWAGVETGLDLVDFWIGGLAEKQMVFGGLLGSTFNFVFETQLEALQDGDRLYYLARTAGLNFLTQLEENSFSELVMRNTNLKHLPADIFSRPAFVFEVGNLGTSGPILDDPATEVNESAELSRMPDGTVRYAGVEHVVMGGTSGDDRIRTSEGDDTIWGDEGDDRIEGGDGNDSLFGGDGNDIITDLNGIDNIKGGPGHDVLSGGPGLGDLLLGGTGNDFVVAGADPKETFGGAGNDFIMAGDSADIVVGGEGDDWIEGGAQADLLQGDNADFFQVSEIVGNDVIIGGGGNDDYDAESGDDILVSDSGIERHEGMHGFDWVTYKGMVQPVDADLDQTIFQLPRLADIRDRFDRVEGLSGWDHGDVLRGDDMTALDLAAVDPIAGHNNALNSPAQIALIDGLQALLGPGVTSFNGGNIILGGGGSDVIEGRGGDDLIDGDRWLNVRIRVRDELGNDIGTADSMGGVLRNKGGVLDPTPASLTLQAAMFSGLIHPGQLEIVREILTAPSDGSIDTAVFSEEEINYDVIVNPDGSTTVIHARGSQTDGTDTLRNIEQLQFGDTIPPGPVTGFAAVPSAGQVALGWTNPVDGAGVRILRSTVAFAAAPDETVNQIVVFDAAGTSFADTAVVNGTPYFYTAFARDAAGNFSGPAIASAIPGGPAPPPGPVTAFVATPGSTLVTLSWTNPVGAAGVRIFRSTVAFATAAVDTADQLTVFNAAGTSFTDTGLVNGTTYFYTAYARNAAGVFSVGATASATPDVPGTIFADDFNGCTSTIDLGANWTIDGRWYCAAGRARGEVAARLATANAAVPADVSVQARVTLAGTGATGSGVVARAGGGSYYAARILATDRLQIVRVNGATTTVLADVAAAVVPLSSHAVSLSVSGGATVQLSATFDGGPAVTATDTAAQRLLSGQSGLLSGTVARTQFDDFVVQGTAAVPPPPPPPPPPPGVVFADDFDACASEVDLGPGWTVDGRWYCRVGRARGEVAERLATANGATPANVTVQARVNLAGAGATGSGVVARASGGAYYAARLLATNRVQIVRVSGATTTVLADVAASVPALTFHTLSLTVSGGATVELTARFNGAPVASTTDASAARLLNGQGGLLSGTVARTQFDDFTIHSP